MLINRRERCMCTASAVRLHNAGPQHQAYMLGVMLDVAPHSVGRDGLRVYVPRREERP
jgi:hypothetical protein